LSAIILSEAKYEGGLPLPAPICYLRRTGKLRVGVQLPYLAPAS